jgi:hypothetical protein
VAVEVMEWPELEAIPAGVSTDCADMVADPAAPEPVSPGWIIVPPDMQGAGQEGWFFQSGPETRRWINVDCRADLEARGVAVEVMEWPELEAIPAGVSTDCADMVADPAAPEPAPVVLEVEAVTEWMLAADGGTVSLGEARLDVPAGVMAHDGNVSITELIVDGERTYDFHIHTQWDGLVAVTLPTDLGGPIAPTVKPEAMTLRHYDEQRSVWIDEPVSVVDFEAGTVSAWADNLSLFKIGIKIGKFITRSNPTELQRARIQSSRDAVEEGVIFWFEEAWMSTYCPHPNDSGPGTVTKWIARHLTSPVDALPRGYSPEYDPILNAFFRTGCETYLHPDQREVVSTPAGTIPLGTLTQEHCRSYGSAFPSHYCDNMPTNAEVEGPQSPPDNDGGSSGSPQPQPSPQAPPVAANLHVYPTLSSVTLRSAATINSNRLGSVSQGQTVPVRCYVVGQDVNAALGIGGSNPYWYWTGSAYVTDSGLSTSGIPHSGVPRC